MRIHVHYGEGVVDEGARPPRVLADEQCARWLHVVNQGEWRAFDANMTEIDQSWMWPLYRIQQQRQCEK